MAYFVKKDNIQNLKVGENNIKIPQELSMGEFGKYEKLSIDNEKDILVQMAMLFIREWDIEGNEDTKNDENGYAIICKENIELLDIETRATLDHAFAVLINSFYDKKKALLKDNFDILKKQLEEKMKSENTKKTRHKNN